jgi:hypothetical protein
MYRAVLRCVGDGFMCAGPQNIVRAVLLGIIDPDTAVDELAAGHGAHPQGDFDLASLTLS